MRKQTYNIDCSGPCRVAWAGEQNATLLTFEGYTMDNEANSLFLVLDGNAIIPIVDYSIIIDSPLASMPDVFRACLMETSADGEQIFKSKPFTIKIEKSADASEEYEVVDERVELVYQKHNALYQDAKAYYETFKQRVDAGEFNGKDGYTPIKGVDYFDGEKGDDYVITESDYEAIAERTKYLVPPYDDTEIRSELSRTDDRLDALWKMNRGQTYDVYESASEDYAKVVPSGSHYASVDVVGGKSVVWNQQVAHADKTINKGHTTFVHRTDGTITATSTGESDDYYTFINVDATPFRGHRLYVSGCPLGGGAGDGSYYIVGGSEFSFRDKGQGYIGVVSATSNNIVISVDVQKLAITNLVFKPRLFDLTQMFGSGNEPTSVDDARIKMIEQYAEEHPEYNSGEIVSSMVDAVEVQGKNLFDVNAFRIYPNNIAISGESVDVFTPQSEGNRLYTVGIDIDIPAGSVVSYEGVQKPNGATNGRLRFVYEDGEIIEAYVTGPNGEAYARGTRTFSKKVVALRFNWSSFNSGYTFKNLMFERGSTPTPYSPYRKETIPTSFPTLRSAGSVYDYIDLNKGELHRRVGVAMFDALRWAKGYSSRSGMYYYEAELPNVAENRVGRTPNMLTEYYINPTGNQYPTSVNYGVYVASNRFITIYTESTPVGTLCYELLEETIEPIDTSMLNEWLEVEANGSITFVNDGKLLVPNTEKFVRKLNEV